MSRPKLSDYDRIKQYVARCDLVGLRQIRELVEFAMMREGIEPPAPAKRQRKAAGQGALALGEEQSR